VDGPDELAVAIGEGFGRVCVASGIFSAPYDRDPAVEEKKNDWAARQSGGAFQARKGGTGGTVRRLSGKTALTMTAQVWIAVLVGLAATVDDLARRQIANWIPAAALAGGFGWQIGQNGWIGALHALAGAAAGFGVFLIFYLLGGMGGGDVKLMAGFGALLGTGRLLEAALWTAGAGGLLALGALAYQGVRGRFVTPKAAETAEEKERRDSIPYAPAIAIGVWLSLVPKG
jgi:prepilin peptidase CpaA